MVIIVFGLPGSGKSTLAKALAGHLKAAYLSSDRIRRSLIRDIEYTPEEKSAVYDRMLQLTTDAVSRNNDDVVVDATFQLAAHREQFKAALAAETPLYFIEVRALESVIRERLAVPREDSDADFTVYQKISAEWEPEQGDHLILWSESANLTEMLRQALNYVNTIYDDTAHR